MSNNYPHLLEITTSDYTQRTYIKGLGVVDSDLTDEEKIVLDHSKHYIEQYCAEKNEKLLKRAIESFERLRDIPDMPNEALDILRKWTTRDEDEDEDEWDYDIDE